MEVHDLDRGVRPCTWIEDDRLDASMVKQASTPTMEHEALTGLASEHGSPSYTCILRPNDREVQSRKCQGLFTAYNLENVGVVEVLASSGSTVEPPNPNMAERLGKDDSQGSPLVTAAELGWSD